MSSMFKTRRKPADTPFIHGADCKFSNVQPAWSFLPGSGGQWERACRCHREAITVLDEAIDPASSAAEPSWRAAEHGAACEATEVEQVVKIEKREGGSGWRAVCLACTWVTIFFWAPDRTDKFGRPISREANVMYRYELKRQPAPV
jgi:hypothetical protein